VAVERPVGAGGYASDCTSGVAARRAATRVTARVVTRVEEWMLEQRPDLNRLDLTNEELAKALGLTSLAEMCAARREADEQLKRAEKNRQQQHLDLRDRLEWLIDHSISRMGVTRDDLVNPGNRKPPVCMARHIILYVIRVQEKKSYPEITDLIEFRIRKMNHSSVVRAVKKISDIVGAGGTENAYTIDNIMRRYALLRG